LIQVTPSTGLLRVSAEATADHPEKWNPVLVISEGEREERIAPLPTGPDPPGAALAAFRVPMARLEHELTFSLELDEDTVVELGAPARHDLARRRPRPHRPAAPPAPPASARRPPGAESRPAAEPRPGAESRPAAEPRPAIEPQLDGAPHPAADPQADADAALLSILSEISSGRTDASPLDRWFAETIDALGATAPASPAPRRPDRLMAEVENALHEAFPQSGAPAPHRHHDGSASDRLEPYLPPKPGREAAEALDQLVADLAEIEPRPRT
jgi:hypothetical protein